MLPEELVLDFALAWTFGIVFQYFTVVPMRGESPLKGIRTAIKVDTASIVAFQVGLFGWMAISDARDLAATTGSQVDSPDFWFEMQVGMVLGFLTAWPVNRLLVSHGIKEKMDYRRHLGMILEQLADERAASAEPTRRERGERGTCDRQGARAVATYRRRSRSGPSRARSPRGAHRVLDVRSCAVSTGVCV